MIDRFQFRKPHEEVKHDPPDELIPGFIDQGLIILAAKPAAGKTFLAIKICVHIASGLHWRGKDVEQGMVVYCLAEGTAFFHHRVTTACDDIFAKADDMPFYTLPNSLNLMSDKGGKPSDDVVTLVEKIKGLEAESKFPIKLVVFDTLSRYMPAGDENNQEDASALIHGCQYIMDNLGCSVMLLHHMRKDQKQIRGSTVLTGAADEVILSKMWGEKMIDGPILWTTDCDLGKRKDRDDANEWTKAKVNYMSDGGLWITRLWDFDELNYDLEPHLYKTDEGEWRMMPVFELIDEPSDPSALTELSAEAKKVIGIIQNNGPIGVRALMRASGISQGRLYKILDVLETRGVMTKGQDKKYSFSGPANPFGI